MKALDKSRSQRSGELRLPPDITPSDLLRAIIHLRAQGKHAEADVLASHLPPSDPFAHLNVPPMGQMPNGNGEPGGSVPGKMPAQVPHPDNPESEGSLPPQITKAHDGTYKFGCVYLIVPEPFRSRIMSMGRLIPDEDLADDGREDTPHCTAFFGLHDADPNPVFDVLSHFRPVRLKMEKASVFHNDKYDVVKIDVESDQLRRMNAEFRNLPHTTEYRNFVPHITIAYVKAGKGKFYAAYFNAIHDECICDTAVFSDADKNRMAYPLGRTITVNKAAMSYLHGECGGALVPPAATAKKIKLRRAKRKLGRILKGVFPEQPFSLTLPAAVTKQTDLEQFDAESFVFGVAKAWDESGHPREKEAHDTKKPGEFAPGGKGEGAKKAPELTDEQKEVLRTLAETFPDGIADFLNEKGVIDRAHYESDDEKQARADAPKHIEAFNDADQAIGLRHEANEPVQVVVDEDDAINQALNVFMSSEHFNMEPWTTPSDDTELGTAFAQIQESLKAIEESEAPGSVSDRPDPDNFYDGEITDENEHDSPVDWHDAVQEAREARESNRDDFNTESDTWAQEVADASEKFRDEQTDFLTQLREEVKDALAADDEDWADIEPEAADAMKGQLHVLAGQVNAVLKRLEGGEKTGTVEKAQLTIMWDEEEHPRETESHDDKRPGEFAPRASSKTGREKSASSAEERQPATGPRQRIWDKSPVYLTGSTNRKVTAALKDHDGFGVLLTPATKGYKSHLNDFSQFAIDNGCFSQGGAFNEKEFLDMVRDVTSDPAIRKKCLFAVAPDVYDPTFDNGPGEPKGRGDPVASIKRSLPVLPKIRALGVPAALVAQDGLEDMVDEIPWDDFDVLFIGGSTAFKMLYHEDATEAIKAANDKTLDPEERRKIAFEQNRNLKWLNLMWQVRAHGKSIHVGRVNSFRRLAFAHAFGAESADGTFLAFGPDKNLPKLMKWMDKFEEAEESVKEVKAETAEAIKTGRVNKAHEFNDMKPKVADLIALQSALAELTRQASEAYKNGDLTTTQKFLKQMRAEVDRRFAKAHKPRQ